ncbi:hypothetical protein HYT95_02910, partial [Candidatus Peregrinibacteria bacterium]|nr:hypothetical protein [Candidatus Peregrinibacteria bacterium]
MRQKTSRLHSTPRSTTPFPLHTPRSCRNYLLGNDHHQCSRARLHSLARRIPKLRRAATHAAWLCCHHSAPMHLKELRGKKICILGFGREGQATLKALEKYAPDSSITIADQNPELRIKNYEYQCGEHYLKNLDHFDVIIKSPGIPPSILHPYNLQPTTYNLTNATQIFLDSIADTGATVIGVTGSKGKSTTASLIFSILNSQFS